MVVDSEIKKKKIFPFNRAFKLAAAYFLETMPLKVKKLLKEFLKIKKSFTKKKLFLQMVMKWTTNFGLLIQESRIRIPTDEPINRFVRYDCNVRLYNLRGAPTRTSRQKIWSHFLPGEKALEALHILE